MKELIAGTELALPGDPKHLAAAPSRVRYQVLAFASVLALITYIQRLALVRDSGPVLKESLGLNDAQMGDAAAAFLVAYGLCQVPGGWLADRLGARHVIAALVVGWSLLTGVVALAALMSAAVAFPFFVAVLFCFDLLQAGLFPAWSRVMADWMPVHERASAQGTIWTFSRLGGALVPFVFLGLLGVLGSWTAVFWV